VRKQSPEERRVRLVAGRHGLQLIRHRHFAANHRKLYCLRPLWDAGYVVSKQPDGGFGYVYAPTSREKSATWLSLPEIEQLLANWSEPAPRARSHRRDPSACTPIYYRMAEARANATQSTSWRDEVSSERAMFRNRLLAIPDGSKAYNGA